MPKILLFAPCEKIIIDGVTNNVTLISLLQRVIYRIKTNVQIGPNAAVPIQWDTLAMWQREEGDEGTTFNQRIELRSASNQVLIDRQSPFRFETRFARVITRAQGFPIGTPGFLSLVLSYKRPESEWIEVGNFPLELIAETVP
jgi:hypothetical protein